MSMCIMVMYIALVWTRIKDFIIFQWRSTDIVKHFAMIIICRRLYNIPLPVFYIYRFRLCLENNFHSLVPRYRYWDNIRHNIIIWYTACRSRFRMFFFIHRVFFSFVVVLESKHWKVTTGLCCRQYFIAFLVFTRLRHNLFWCYSDRICEMLGSASAFRSWAILVSQIHCENVEAHCSRTLTCNENFNLQIKLMMVLNAKRNINQTKKNDCIPHVTMNNQIRPNIFSNSPKKILFYGRIYSTVLLK